MTGREHFSPRLRRATTPGWLWVPSLLALAFLAGPLIALGAAADWGRLGGQLTDPSTREALWLSLRTSTVSTGLCLALGIPLSVLLSRLHGPLLQLMRGVLLIPLVLSPVVSGLALLYFWGRRGTLGGWLESMGWGVGFSPAAVVLVQVFVSLPFFVVAALSSIESVDANLELSAANAGANAAQIVRYITLPLAAPGIIVGTLLAFARSLGEYGATITFAGSVAGETRTLPLQIELALNSNAPSSAVGISIMLVGLYLLVLIAAGAGVQRIFGRRS
ncbi:ABC transporter permease [Paeniglutamicibacter cryotolerans]|uniref:Molybdate transport system permease protein n=1 Tax=Paeniglutamicibacter cryotolerans TaxID=670079 RepID=A0A839QJ02_9MICC|nr:ABC transporter permease [Paeniglutamicibacter cryotolerans]MBB2996169.1 molybdate transport system permease protein [Paeniglutamicibacter cryotolerans]